MNSFSFEGNYKAKRNINLGGVRAQEDKKRLLEKAQRERKAREAERLRNRNVTRIQAFYRGRQEAFRHRIGLRQEFQQSFTKLQRLFQEQGTTPSDKGRQEIQTMRLLLGIMKDDEPESRKLATQVFEWLLIPGNNAIAQRWLWEHDEVGDIWEWQLKLLSSKITLNFSQGVANDNLVRLKFMETLLRKDTYTSKGHSAEVADSVRFRMASHLLIRKNVFNLIHKYLLEQGLEKLDQIEALVGILINVLDIEFHTPGYTSSREESIMTAFVTQVLTIRLLIDRISEKHYADIVEYAGIGRILQAVLQLGNEIRTEQSNVIGLLENIISLKRRAKSALRYQDNMKFVQVISFLLQQLSPSFFIKSEDNRGTQMVESEEEDSDDEIKDVDMDVGTKKIDELKWADLDSTEQKCLSQLHDPDFLSDIVNSLFAHHQLNQASEHSAIMLIAELFNLLFIRWPSYRDKIFGLLLYNLKVPYNSSIKQNFVHELCSIWMSGPLSQEIGKLTDAGSSTRVMSYITNPAYRGDWNIMILLCELYHRSLITLGDDEFFNPQEGKNPLTTEQILDLSLDLKSITFALFWNASSLESNASVTTSIDVNALRTSVTRLIQHLHARDSRRPFCPPNHWFIVGLDMATFRETAIADEFSIESEVQDVRNPRKAPSKLRMARISPHLGILNNIPFVLPFEDRVQVFRMFIRNDRKPQYVDMGVPDNIDIEPSFFPPVARVTIRRDHVFEDGFTHLYGLGADLRKKVAISFVDEFGLLEAGVDGGGVFKEFLTTLARQAFDVNYGLFMVTQDQLLYPNSSKYAREPTQLAFFEFLGLIIGKALYEGILVEAAFAGFFLSKCLGKMNYLDDLPSLDYELYKGLINLKNYDGNVEDLCLDFSITDSNIESSEIIDLIPNGRNIPVTNENRIRYIYLVANYRLNIQIGKQCKAFFRGLSTIIDPKWIRMFNQKELQILLGGATIPIDLEDLRANTVYSGYSEDEDIIENLWTVLREANNEQRRKFIKFVTSCSRPPLLGFKELNPQFCIRNAGVDDTRLPTSSTCVNLLKLPRFSNIDILKQKLLYAINAEAGFDLS